MNQPSASSPQATKKVLQRFGLAVLVGLLLKIVLALYPLGTLDCVLYFRYGISTVTKGYAAALELPAFNITPLLAYYSGWIAQNATPADFLLHLKLPGIVCSTLTCAAVFWLQRCTGRIPLGALILFALSPTTIAIDGFHGNYDSVLVAFTVFATCACYLPKPNALLCASMLAIACQIKVVALITAPVFFFFWLKRGQAARFALGVTALCAAGWSIGLTEAPLLFFKRVLAYSSVSGDWGISLILRMFGLQEFGRPTWTSYSPLQSILNTTLKVVVIASAFIVGWRTYRSSSNRVLEGVCWIWLIFFVLTPGFGVQYLVWALPFVLLASWRSYVWLELIAGTSLFIYYTKVFRTIRWPFQELLPFDMALFIPSWLCFLCVAFWHLKRTFPNTNAPSCPATPEPAQSGSDR